MICNANLTRAVQRVLALGVAVAGVSAPAYAQDQEQDADDLGTVVVTGSRIRQPNLTSISPVVAVSSDEVRLQGVTRVEDLINNLPQAFADFGGNVSNGATGGATVNLRGLGAQRTLVLVNGRRLMPGDPTQSGNAAPDLNQIPAALIERIDVLTGGASAVYGADAVAGVVNFVMQDNFEGIRLDGQYSIYQHDNDDKTSQARVNARNFDLPDGSVRDGSTRDLTFVAGINTEDGRGNATVYLGYRELDALKQDQRDFSACAYNSSSAGDPTGQLACGGSGTTSPARFTTATGDFTIGAGNQLRPYTSAGDAYNFAPNNYYQRPDERKTAGLFAHYDVSPTSRAYAEFSFMDDRTLAQIAPSGAFYGGGEPAPPFFGQYLINCNNPLLSTSMVQEFCTASGLGSTDDALITIGKRNVEGGPRISDLRHTSFRGVIGFQGEINDTWGYDVYGQYGTTIYAQNYQNDFSLQRLKKALNAVTDGSGNIVCRVNADADLSNDDARCVPYNIFQVGAVTPQQLAYLQIPAFQDGSTTEIVLNASITGNLGEYGLTMPWANDGLAVAFGTEYRQEESQLRADLAFQTNDLLGQGSPTLDTTGRFDIMELFGEARMPLVQDKPFAQVISVEAGYRWSDYSLGFSTDTYKFGADWAPADLVRFRASYQRAVRAPNIQELYLAPRVQLNGTSDDCASASLGALPSASFEECARTGVTAAQYGNILENPAGQYNGLVGGNPNLNPESADTFSFGLVFTPGSLQGFSLALDYYDIKVENLIGSVGQDFTLRQCMATGDPQFCSLINRSPNSGSLWIGGAGYVNDPIINTGSLQATGYDLEANYRFEFGERVGSLALNLIGTLTDELTFQPFSGLEAAFDCTGLYGSVCGTPTPEWRHKLRATWMSPWDLSVSLTWRYIDEVLVDNTSSDPDLSSDVVFSDLKLGARSYFDLAASYSFNKDVTARIGITNLLDKDPPLLGATNCVATYCNGNTFPQVYDTLGRNAFVSVTWDF